MKTNRSDAWLACMGDAVWYALANSVVVLWLRLGTMKCKVAKHAMQWRGENTKNKYELHLCQERAKGKKEENRVRGREREKEMGGGG